MLYFRTIARFGLLLFLSNTYLGAGITQTCNKGTHMNEKRVNRMLRELRGTHADKESLFMGALLEIFRKQKSEEKTITTNREWRALHTQLGH